MQKIAVITCYKDPNYVRSRSIRAALETLPDVQQIIIKNRRTNALRYLEVLAKVVRVRFSQKPDVYLLNFRGYELLPFVLLLAGRKPLVFDEFINLTEWVVDEHKKLKAQSLPAKILNSAYGWLLRRCAVILADTEAHAKYSSERSNVSLQKYVALPVGTDDQVFHPLDQPAQTKFDVFYYGSMLPLHGADYVLEAAALLKDHDVISFTFVGGKASFAEKIAEAQKSGAHVYYIPWVPFEELPSYIARSGLLMGGPFGNTVQSQFVVTGKSYQFLTMAMPTLVGANKATSDFIDKQNCLLVPQGDANAIANAILWAASHPAELKQIGIAGRKLYDDKFSNRVIADQLSQLLRSL